MNEKDLTKMFGGLLSPDKIKDITKKAEDAAKTAAKQYEEAIKPKRVSFPLAEFSTTLDDVITIQGSNPAILLTSKGDRVELTGYSWIEANAIHEKALK